MKNVIRLLSILLLSPLAIQAQISIDDNPLKRKALNCGSSEMMKMRPELLHKQQQLEELLLTPPTQRPNTKPPALPYVLPVVVHIIHQNGAENISDAQVYTAIEHLNQAFAHQGYYAQQGDGANTQIQFCLARRDPDGQLTNGITRTASALTDIVIEQDDQDMKDLSRWDPKNYVNVWVVRSITSQSSGPGVIGYAYLAAAHGEPYDGLVCEAPYFGSSPSNDAVVIHEIGHYLNLYHTFEGGCPNTNCQASGDRVCDTPPDQATHTSCLYNSCHTDADDTSSNNPFTSDVDDATENFMDYSPFPCYRAFTAGQGARMRQAIENLRSSLLLSPGCMDPCPVPITAAYTASAIEVTTGETVFFTNHSTEATNFEWYVNGNFESNTIDFNHQFLNDGRFPVTLKAVNADPNCVSVYTDTILVKCGAQAAFSLSATELTAGETLTATNNSSGATTYIWSINGFPTGTTADLNYTFNFTGFYTITLQAINEYCNASISKSIFVYPDSPCRDSISGRHYSYDIPPSFNYFPKPAYGLDGSMFAYSYLAPKGLIVKYDPKSNKLWQTAVNVPYNGVEDICPMEDGGAIFVNDYKHTVFKINADGELAWSKSVVHASGTVEFNTISLDDGALLYAARNGINNDANLYLYKFLSDGTLAWSHHYVFEGDVFFMWDNTAKNENGFWIPGYTQGYIPVYAPTGGVILRFDNDGNIIFSKRYKLENEDNVSIFAMSVNENDEFVASGIEQWNLDINNSRQIIFKANATGAPIWARKFVPLLNEQYGHIQKIITRPMGGYLQMLDFGQTGRKWAAWSETGNLDFVEEITTPGYMDDVLIRNGNMTAFIKKEHTAKDFYLLNLEADGKPSDCANVNISSRQTEGINVIEADFPYTEVSYSPVINPIPLTTSAFSPFSQVPFCAAPPICTEFCDNGRDDDEDGYVDCFDTDCPCFDSDTACTISQAQMPVSGKIKWQSNERSVYPFSTPLIGNLNPQVDKIPEIVTYSMWRDSIYIFRGDGLNKDTPVVFVPAGMQNIDGVAPVLADINSDGVPEMIIGINGKLVVYTNYKEDQSPPFEFWLESSDTIIKPQGKLSVADFDGDGIAEIYVGKQVFGFDFSNQAMPSLTKKLEGTGHSGAYNPFATSYTGHSTAADMLSKTDCNGDPDCAGLELVAGGIIYSVDLDLSDGDGLEIKIQRNLNAMVQGQVYNDGYTQVADMNLDGQPDVVVNSGRNIGATYSSGIYVWDKNGLISYLQNAPSFVPPWQPLTIANVYDDKKAGFAQDFPEIITLHAEPDRLVALNLNAQSQHPVDPFWWRVSTDVHAGYNGVTAFDFDLDGFDEILTEGDTALSIVYGGALPLPAGVNPNTRIISQITDNSYSRNTFPVIADLDHDGSAEIAYTRSVVEGSWLKVLQLRVLESANFPWPNARPVWNQFNYYGVNINDDLSVPKVQQKHWLEMGGIGSGKRPFNTYRSQAASLNPLNINKIKVPDGNLVIDSTHCNTDSFEVFLTICNLGSAALPVGTPVAFYDGDPTTTAAQLLFPPRLLTEALEKGDCKNIKLVIPATYNTSIFAVLNDDGSLTSPFNLTTDFPSTDQPECHYENNIASFSIQNQTPVLDLGPDISLCKNSVVELLAPLSFQRYRWQDGSTNPGFTAFTPGKYWVDAFDACGFAQSDTVNIVLNTLQALHLPDQISRCEGEPLGLRATGFSQYNWFPADSVSCADCDSIQILAKGSFYLSLTASEGDCFVTDSVQILVNPKPYFQLQVQHGNCINPAQIVVDTDTTGLTFAWSDNSTGSGINPTIAGTYTVTVTNALGCKAVDSADVQILASGLSIDFQTTAIPCSGGPGLITATGQGGSGSYAYSWSNGAISSLNEVLLPGQYSLTLTDMSGSSCTSTASVTIGITGTLPLDATVHSITCFGNQNGMAEVTPLSGNAPYSWAWSGGQTTAKISGLSTGLYTVIVSDAISCTGTKTVFITEPTILSASTHTLDFVLCPGASTSIAALATGGTAPYTFLWSNGLADSIISGITAGNYGLTVTDNQNCIGLATVDIETEPLIEIFLDSLAHASGPTTADGSVFVEVSGGIGLLSFLWSNGASTQHLQSVLPGVYTLTVTDAGGCTQSITVEVDFILRANTLSASDWNVVLLPNPAQEDAEAQLIIASSKVQAIEIQLFDMLGSRLWTAKKVLKAGHSEQILQAPKAAGVYWVVLTNGRELKCLKWVVVD